ncbi:hypothetical protein [Streptomyces antimycoticus]|uniref:hypothetical protein n=1 Tax=Streptomyces antimycoticus TaxID=68175 RepID=UPI003823B217
MEKPETTAEWGAALVGDPGLCRARAYIYCGYSLEVGVAYIGMTVAQNGIFGRWGDHLGRALERSSFKRRLHEYDELAWGKIDDLVIFWADMGSRGDFLTVETTHREAVEYLVQRELRLLLARSKPPLAVISKVRSNRAVKLSFVQESASRVIELFELHFGSSPMS